jgi:uncharacterized tellurite resistance protein B-like protein
MDSKEFNQLILRTAFSCMACDGHIDKREIAMIKDMCETSDLFVNFNFNAEIKLFVKQLKVEGKSFILDFFKLIENSELSIEQEILLIDIALKTIKADDQIEYSEVKFFKNIRHRLKVDDDVIRQNFEDIEDFLEKDINTESFLDRLTSQYLDSMTTLSFEELNSIDLNSDEN